jgi:Zn-dependent M28 family amino/carboxypeptidase
LFPLRSLAVVGLEESDLGDDLRRVGAKANLPVLADPEPERNIFIRSDQYSFIRAGIPALSMRVGFSRDSAEHQLVKKWLTERYHGLSDEITQPLDKQAAVDFNRVYVDLLEAIANRPTRPAWNDTSFFKRFAQGN